MKFFFTLVFTLLTFQAFPQTQALQHPRVMELEDEIVREAARYFERRYPGDPFFTKVKILPLRRIEASRQGSEALPYFDSDSEELMDEWDDPTTPLNALKNRIVRISVDVSVPETYEDEKVESIKQDLMAYLRLTPIRDELRIEKKIKMKADVTPAYVYVLLLGIIGAAFVVGIMVKWGLGSSKTQAQTASQQTPVINSSTPSSQSPRVSNTSGGHNKTDVRGDVNVHDPVKSLEIAHKKIDQIEVSKTFPTLRDVIELNELCQTNPSALGGLLYEFSPESQVAVFKVGRDTQWLHAFSNPSDLTQACLRSLDQMSRERDLSSGDREFEDLLIQCWRLGDKAISFFKSIDQNDAFSILHFMPKSESLRIAKKAFPGSWGKLLENRTVSIAIEPKKIQVYLRQAMELEPWFARKLLENYKRDKEILGYLERVTIEDEKDIYETLESESFIHKARPAFYKVFEIEGQFLNEIVTKFPLEKWALVMINSSRSYIKIISDQLDDRKRLVFSSQLKRLDQQGFDPSEQNHWKRLIADEANRHFRSQTTLAINSGEVSESDVRSA